MDLEFQSFQMNLLLLRVKKVLTILLIFLLKDMKSFINQNMVVLQIGNALELLWIVQKIVRLPFILFEVSM